MDLSANLSLGKICIQVDMLAQSSQTLRGDSFLFGGGVGMELASVRPRWGTSDGLKLQITHRSDSFSLFFMKG